MRQTFIVLSFAALGCGAGATRTVPDPRPPVLPGLDATLAIERLAASELCVREGCFERFPVSGVAAIAFSADEAVAVGPGNLVSIYDGAHWSFTWASVEEPLYGVDVTPSGGFVAVGGDMAILAREPHASEWTILHAPGGEVWTAEGVLAAAAARSARSTARSDMDEADEAAEDEADFEEEVEPEAEEKSRAKRVAALPTGAIPVPDRFAWSVEDDEDRDSFIAVDVTEGGRFVWIAGRQAAYRFDLALRHLHLAGAVGGQRVLAESDESALMFTLAPTEETWRVHANGALEPRSTLRQCQVTFGPMRDCMEAFDGAESDADDVAACRALQFMGEVIYEGPPPAQSPLDLLARDAAEHALLPAPQPPPERDEGPRPTPGGLFLGVASREGAYAADGSGRLRVREGETWRVIETGTRLPIVAVASGASALGTDLGTVLARGEDGAYRDVASVPFAIAELEREGDRILVRATGYYGELARIVLGPTPRVDVLRGFDAADITGAVLRSHERGGLFRWDEAALTWTPAPPLPAGCFEGAGCAPFARSRWRSAPASPIAAAAPSPPFRLARAMELELPPASCGCGDSNIWDTQLHLDANAERLVAVVQDSRRSEVRVFAHRDGRLTETGASQYDVDDSERALASLGPLSRADGEVEPPALPGNFEADYYLVDGVFGLADAENRFHPLGRAVGMTEGVYRPQVFLVEGLLALLDTEADTAVGLVRLSDLVAARPDAACRRVWVSDPSGATNVRATPSARADTVTTTPTGSVLAIDSVRGSWAHVSASDPRREGWVHASNVRCVQ